MSALLDSGVPDFLRKLGLSDREMNDVTIIADGALGLDSIRVSIYCDEGRYSKTFKLKDEDDETNIFKHLSSAIGLSALKRVKRVEIRIRNGDLVVAQIEQYLFRDSIKNLADLADKIEEI